MRVGQNPAKSIDYVAQPEKVTIAVVSYIPFLSGYYRESLDILKVCLNSIWDNTNLPFDLLVFDNASCSQVQAYLIEARDQGRIQYLVLSDKNIGKGGAWNFIFGAVPGEFIAYADGDIFFYPGWLTATIDALESFQNAGMVTGMPLWSPQQFSTATIEWAQNNPDIHLEKGALLPWEDYWRHSRSLGKQEAEARQHYETCEEYRLEYLGSKFYIGAGHFQFVAKRQILQSILPVPSHRPMGQVRELDIALNEQGYLRLSTQEWWVEHMGNTLPANKKKQTEKSESSWTKYKSPIWYWVPFRKFLEWTHGKTFEILYKK